MNRIQETNTLQSQLLSTPFFSWLIIGLGSFICIVLTLFLLCPAWIVMWRPLLFFIAITILCLYSISMYKTVSLYRKQLEKEALLKRLLKKKASYLESIIQNSLDIIITIDINGTIIKTNTGSQIQSGYGLLELRGRPIQLLFLEQDKIKAFIEKALQNNTIPNEQFTMITKEGVKRFVDISISRIRYANIEMGGFVITARDITDMKNLEQQLRQSNEQLNLLAITDSLTGLFNVRHFYEQIKKELKRFSRGHNYKVSIMLMDIDHFKQLNDSEGHQMGDQVLISLAQVINTYIRKDIDSAYRYGGDEFIVILPDTDKSQALVVAERILKQFNALQFGNTSLSLGIAEIYADASVEVIIKRADDALYAAKRGGKSRIQVN